MRPPAPTGLEADAGGVGLREDWARVVGGEEEGGVWPLVLEVCVGMDGVGGVVEVLVRSRTLGSVRLLFLKEKEG